MSAIFYEAFSYSTQFGAAFLRAHPVAAAGGASGIAYAASKAALDSLGWSLRTELEGTNVAVQVVHPGATRTRFFEKVGVPAGAFDTSSFADPVCPLFCFVSILELQYFVLLW